MKKVIITASVVFLLALLSFPVSATESTKVLDSQTLIDDYTGELFSALDEDSARILSEFGLDSLDSSSVLSLSFSDILSVIKNEFNFSVKENSSMFFRLLALIILMSALAGMGKTDKSGKLTDDIFLFVIILMISASVSEIIRLLVSVFTVTEKFLITLTPIMTVLLSFSGNVTFSAIYSTMTVSFCQALSFISENLIIPLTSVYFALIVSMSFNEVTDGERVCSAVNGFFSAFLGTVSTVFMLLLSAKDILSKDIDSVLYKSGKYLISSFIPVVGSAVSGILGSIVGSLSIVRSTVGVFAIIAAVSVNLPLFIKILFLRISLGTVSLINGGLGNSRASSMIRCITKSLRLLSVLAFFELITVIISTGLAVSVRGNLQ